MTSGFEIIKVSSKRQITIPAQAFKDLSIENFVTCAWNDAEINIKLLRADDEDLSTSLLQSLVQQGLTGNELVERFSAEKKKFKATLNDVKAEAEFELTSGQALECPIEELFG